MALILAASYDVGGTQSVARFLGRLNHQVVIAHSVQFALSWLQQQSQKNPDLVLADVGLRVFGGLEFIESLKSSEKWKSIPVLVQTKSQKCGMFDFCEGIVVKPYSCRELTRIVNLILGVR